MLNAFVLTLIADALIRSPNNKHVHKKPRTREKKKDAFIK